MNTQPIIIIIVGTILVGALTTTAVTLAAGGGGGGGSASVSQELCTSDTWVCTEWNNCSKDGKQTRTCTLSVDCSFTETPKPAETQTCTPPCSEDTWECTTWSECAATRDQMRTCTLKNDCPLVQTPKPAETQTCTPSQATLKAAKDALGADKQTPETPAPAAKETIAQKPTPETDTRSTAPAPKKTVADCTVDTWECGPWQKCDRNGEQSRTCAKTFECPAADTEIPPATRVCQELQCSPLPTLRERVECRLNLTQKGLARELSLEYLPEECRFSPAGDPVRTNCIELYKSYRPCWELPVGPERSACARKIIGLPDNLPDQATACRQRFNPEPCLNNLRQKIYNLIKFRFYDLEERAEDLLEAGADRTLVAKFVATVYEKKQAFNQAQSKTERRQIILAMRTAWQQFVQSVKGNVKPVDSE